MKLKSLPLLLGSILVSHLAGIIGSFATASSVSTWYVTLSKPFFSPPNWLFAPVWLTLYTLMGISLFLVARKDLKKKKVKQAVTFFLVHLLFNTLWSLVFFGLQNIFLALVIITSLLVMIANLIRLFADIDSKAALLLTPYFAWVGFASVLNLFLWRLN